MIWPWLEFPDAGASWPRLWFSGVTPAALEQARWDMSLGDLDPLPWHPIFFSRAPTYLRWWSPLATILHSGLRWFKPSTWVGCCQKWQTPSCRFEFAHALRPWTYFDVELELSKFEDLEWTLIFLMRLVFPTGWRHLIFINQGWYSGK